MNAEICITRTAGIKYMFKYITKGSDRVTINLVPDGPLYIDEIKQHQDARYLSASEAVWNFLEYEMVKKEPNAVRLDVNLEDRHKVYFVEGDERNAANRRRPGIKLTE